VGSAIPRTTARELSDPDGFRPPLARKLPVGRALARKPL